MPFVDVFTWLLTTVVALAFLLTLWSFLVIRLDKVPVRVRIVIGGLPLIPVAALFFSTNALLDEADLPTSFSPKTLTEQADIAILEIFITDLDADQRELTARFDLVLFDTSPAFEEELSSLLLFRDFASDEYDLELTVDAPDSRTYSTEEVQLPVLGDPTRFPFDTYTTLEWIIVVKADGAPTLLTPERVVSLLDFGGFNLSMNTRVANDPPAAVGELGLEVHELELEFGRPRYDVVAFTLAVALFLALILFGFGVALTRIGRDQPISLLLGVAGVGFALPGVRSLLIPSDLNSRTLFDGFVVVPFLAGSVAIILIVGLRLLFESRDWADQ